jgi:spermidine synthase
VAPALVVASGFAALGYQIVWTQQAALWLGHDTAAVLAVVAAFFAGLAVGSLRLGPHIERSARPVRWYVVCEGVIGTWSIAIALLMDPLANALLALTGADPHPAWQWGVAFVGAFALLLPATAAMGATLPAMQRALSAGAPSQRVLPALYAANTAGAVLGVLAAAFWLVPALGLLRTAALCTALNLACALAAWWVLPRQSAPRAEHDGAAARTELPFVLALTGLLGIGYEVVVVRVLSQVTENTVYTFAMLLATYLVGTAAGAAAYRHWLARHLDEDSDDDDALRTALLWQLAAACLVGAASLWAAALVKAWALQVLGVGFASALAAEALLAVIAFLPPTVLMGALFSHLATQALRRGTDFGTALGINTLGAALAPAVFGIGLIATIGPKASLLVVIVGYLLLCTRPLRSPMPWAIAASAVALAVVTPPLRFVDVPEGGRLVSHHEGAMAAVSVVEDAQGVAVLRINNRQQEGSSATRLADARQALLPMLLHPAPRQALFLGLGTGVTASAAAEDPSLHVEVAELLPEVIAAAEHFRQDEQPSRLHVVAADARRFVRTTPKRYDLIVADNFHPARSGSGALYTVEHFRAVRERLAPGGVFCQWLPLHQLDLPTLASIVRSFLAVYPEGKAMLATLSLDTPVLGLVAQPGTAGFSPAQVRARLSSVQIEQGPAAFGLADELTVLGSFVAGPTALAAFAADAPLNTDDHPVVTHRAPRLTYAPDSLPRDRLLALLRTLQADPAEVLDSAAADPQSAARLARYWRARDRFLEAGRDVTPSADVRQMLAQVREPLLEVLRISPDFRPAYEPLLQMASALARSDETAARALLQRLIEAQPDRPDAPAALKRLGR